MPKNPPVDKRRWILVKKPLPRKDAIARRTEETQALRAQLEEAKEELRHLLLVPLPKFTEEYVPVLPGDPRYEKGEIKFDSAALVGKWSFTTSSKMPLCLTKP